MLKVTVEMSGHHGENKHKVELEQVLSELLRSCDVEGEVTARFFRHVPTGGVTKLIGVGNPGRDMRVKVLLSNKDHGAFIIFVCPPNGMGFAEFERLLQPLLRSHRRRRGRDPSDARAD